MKTGTYTFAAVFMQQEDMDRAAAAVLRTLDPDRVTALYPNDDDVSAKIEPDGNAIRRRVVKDMVIGGGAGGALGLGASAALAATHGALFHAAPYLLTAAMGLWTAIVGAVGGAVKGLGVRAAEFDEKIQDALRQGRFVLIVRARNRQERAEMLALARGYRVIRA